MILGINELLKLVKEKKLVENLSQRELENPEGAGFDLRVGELYEIKGKGFLGIEERETPQIKSIAKFDSQKPIKVSLAPKTYYLMRTVEKLNMPDNLLAIFTPRSTLFRSGVYVFGGQTAPGYKGELTVGIYNFRDENFDLEMGSRVFHIMFFEVRGESNLYRGQWQGGRIATKKREKQV
jgi:deoxycytidine triphosphate deaminase